MKRVLSYVLSGVLAFVSLGINLDKNTFAVDQSDSIVVWDGTYDTGWYDSEETELHISTAEEFAGLSELVNAGKTMAGQIIILDTDIYLNDVSNFDNWENEAPVNSWTSIGTGSAFFEGTFCGGGNSITGMYCSVGGSGLFAKTKGVIGNVNCDYAYVEISVTNKPARAGILCGYVLNGEINGCSVSGKLKATIKSNNSFASLYSGGICGEMSLGRISNCRNLGLISNTSLSTQFRQEKYSGGICGLMSNGTISNSCNKGEVTSEDSSGRADVYSGGICGNANYDNGYMIKNCYNSGTIISSKNSGGILGKSQSKSENEMTNNISNVYNVGVITGKSFSGGILGTYTSDDYSGYPSIDACYYLSTTALRGVGNGGIDETVAKSSVNMQKESFAESLGNAFVYQEDGYPLLAWEGNGNGMVYGDVNLDGICDSEDVVLLQHYLLCTTTLTKTQTEQADMDDDGELNGFDLAILKRIVSIQT